MKKGRILYVFFHIWNLDVNIYIIMEAEKKIMGDEERISERVGGVSKGSEW